MNNQHLKYPIGKFEPKAFTEEERKAAIKYFGDFPSILRSKVVGLDGKTLEKVYRKDGWSIRQLVHHLADSHMNMLTRLKLALTEDNPHIRGYEENLWAKLPDYVMDIELSLMMLEVIHAKTVFLYQSLDLERTYFHPQYKESYSLRNLIHMYEWHSKHHLEHIKLALQA